MAHLFFGLILFGSGCLVSCNANDERLEFDISGTTIHLAAEIDSPGFFENNSIYYGYMCDLLKSYADSRGAIVEISLVPNDSMIVKKLRDNSADIGLTLLLNNDFCKENKLLKTNINYKEDYVVISKDKDLKIDNIDSLVSKMNGRRVAITNTVEELEFFKIYSQPQYGINFIGDPHRLSREVARDLAFRKADFLICSKVNSRLLKYIFSNFKVVYQLPVASLSSFYFGDQNEDFRKDFTDWYNNEYLGSESENYNHNLYSTQQYMQDFIHKGYLVPYHSFSPFDDIFKKVARDAGVDWRLLCSIGKSESGYNKNLISEAGAVGVMQILPSIAKRYGFDVDSLSDIEYNIGVSAFIVKDIMRMLKYDTDTLTLDQASILCATYCTGIGRVNDAKRVARSLKLNSNTWEGIKEGINCLKVDSIYSNKKLVTYGELNGGVVIHYSQKTAKKYIEIKKDTTNE